jgi:hypothetical protein
VGKNLLLFAAAAAAVSQQTDESGYPVFWFSHHMFSM